MLSKSIMRINHAKVISTRMYSTASSEYQTLDDHLFYVPAHPVQISDKLAVFDNTNTKERRHAPFELKETTFKNAMGFAGTMVLDHLFHMGVLTQIAAAGWCF